MKHPTIFAVSDPPHLFESTSLRRIQRGIESLSTPSGVAGFIRVEARMATWPLLGARTSSAGSESCRKIASVARLERLNDIRQTPERISFQEATEKRSGRRKSSRGRCGSLYGTRNSGKSSTEEVVLYRTNLGCRDAVLVNGAGISG